MLTREQLLSMEHDALVEYTLSLQEGVDCKKSPSSILHVNDILGNPFVRNDFKVTIPSHDTILKDSAYDIKLMTILAKESIKNTETNDRIVLKESNGADIITILIHKYNLSESYIRKGINKLIKDKHVKESKTSYKLNIKKDNKFYVEIHSTLLDKIYSYKDDNADTLSTAKKKRITVDTMLRLMAYLSWKLKNGARSDLSNNLLCKAIGLVNTEDNPDKNKIKGEPSKEHTDKLSANIQALKDIGAITIFTDLEITETTGLKQFSKNNTYALGRVILQK